MPTKIEELIISHNKDAQNRKLVAFYDRKSTMEKMGIARSETAHSAFLANLLKSDNGYRIRRICYHVVASYID